MTDLNNNSGDEAAKEGVTIEHDANETPGEKRASGWSFPKLSLAVGAAMAAVIGLGAVAQGAGGEGWGKHGGMGAKFMEWRMTEVLEDIGANKEQTDKIKVIFEKTRTDLEPVREGFRDTRGQLVTLLSAPSVDPAAIEKLRAERITAMDEASKKAVASIVEAAQVLTPEQRAKLATEMENMKGRGHH